MFVAYKTHFLVLHRRMDRIPAGISKSIEVSSLFSKLLVVYICVPTASKALKSSEKGLSHPAISDRFNRGKRSIDV